MRRKKVSVVFMQKRISTCESCCAVRTFLESRRARMPGSGSKALRTRLTSLSRHHAEPPRKAPRTRMPGTQLLASRRARRSS